ncbi:hypothetical protein [Tahibacter amnicola]|uniref:Uncharacterized protein n=1 Tax=Tahibacter amnicola TaxID=2976241 RepID=A0ABY6BBV0_9GAMM|nr:hypothetical protein [Tahibacter amnicola]UXI67027.1 hypothetical protein N4264_20075 [Tahibacter amnicola]
MLAASLAVAHSAGAESAYYPIYLGTLVQGFVGMPSGITTATLRTERTIEQVIAQPWRVMAEQAESYSLREDPTPADLYDLPLAATGYFLRPLTAASGEQAWFAEVTAESTVATARWSVTVGVDRNGDGLPSANEVLCRARSAGSRARCRLDLRAFPSRSAWVLTRMENTPGSDAVSVRTTFAGADFTLRNGQVIAEDDYGDSLIVEVPERISSDIPFTATFRYTARPDEIGSHTDFAGLLLTDPTFSPTSMFIAPVELTFAPVTAVDQPTALKPTADPGANSMTLALAPGQAHEKLYVDNPGYSAVAIGVDSLENVDVYISRVELPVSGVDSTAVKAPPRDRVDAVMRRGTGQPGSWSWRSACESCQSAAARGRWFITPVNLSTRPVTLRVRAVLADGLNAPPRGGLGLAEGNYFNPQRSGDGLFLDYVNGRLAAFFYTFDDAGLPTWYALAGTSELSDTAGGEIYSTQYGTRAVGRFAMTRDPLRDNEMVFSWSINEKAGSNRYVLAAASGCSPLGLSGAPVSGHWFSPVDAGWGINVLDLGATTVLGGYFYDADHVPRWVIGSSDHAGGTKGFDLQQVRGACPTCRYVAPTAVRVGTWSIDFAAAPDATSRPNIVLAAPLQGQFTATRPLWRATGPMSCPSNVR